MHQDVGNGTCRQCGIDVDVGASTGRQHHGAISRRERLRGLPVQRHHPNLMISDFYRNNMALKAVYKAQSQPFVETG